MDFMNSLCGFDKLPKDYRDQIDKVVALFRETLGNNLFSVYLQGSICLGAFCLKHSDVDLLMACNEPIPPQTRLLLGEKLLALHGKPADLEISVLQRKVMMPFTHPTPTQFHFSDFHVQRYTELSRTRDMTNWILSSDFDDPDVACHATLTLQSGIKLYGADAKDWIPANVKDYFWDSICEDGLPEYDFTFNGQKYAASNFLILLRIWSYPVEKRILSKAETVLWGKNILPEEYKHFAVEAGEAWYGEGVFLYGNEELAAVRDYVLDKIHACMQA